MAIKISKATKGPAWHKAFLPVRPGIDQKHEKCLLIKNVPNRNKFFFALSRAFFVRKTFWHKILKR
jgi:hypothetical protein